MWTVNDVLVDPYPFYFIKRVWIDQDVIDGPRYTLESGIDVVQGITVGPGKFVKKNKHRALNKRRA